MNKKQLVVLLCVAAWVSAVAIYQLTQWQAEWDKFAPILAKSIPAFAFGAVLYFWFRQKR